MTNREKRRARNHAYLLLYQWELSNLPPKEVAKGYWEEVEEESAQVRELAERLFFNTLSDLEQVDDLIEKHLKKGWTVSRLLPVDRAVLRVSTYEILRGSVSPPEAVINDAVEFAKLYGEDPKSPSFINALLDKVKKDVKG
jgi:N utilization substance protein B